MCRVFHVIFVSQITSIIIIIIIIIHIIISRSYILMFTRFFPQFELDLCGCITYIYRFFIVSCALVHSLTHSLIHSNHHKS